MDDTTEDSGPKTDLNSPKNYSPTPSVALITGMVNDISGGNGGNVVAGAQGAQKTSNDFFSTMASSLQELANHVQSAFNVGDIKGQATAAQKAIEVQGQAQATVSYSDATQAAKAAQATAEKVVAAKMGNDPDAVKLAHAMGTNAKIYAESQDSIANMRSTGFVDNPLSYIFNHLIGIPYEEWRSEGVAGSMKQESDFIHQQASAVSNWTAADVALNSKDTVEKANAVAMDALAKAAKDAATLGINTTATMNDLALKAAANRISQGHLDLAKTADQRAGVQLGLSVAADKRAAEAHALGMAEAPYKLEMTRIQAQYAESLRQGSIIANQERALHLGAETSALGDAKAVRDSTQAAVQSVSEVLTGTPLDATKMKPGQQDAFVTIGNNLTATGQVAPNPFVALKLLDTTGLPLNKLSAGTQFGLQELYGIRQLAIDRLDKVQPGVTKPTGVNFDNALAQNMITELNSRQAQGYKPESSLFSLPSIGTAVELPAFKNNPIIQSLRPLAMDSAGQPVSTPLNGDRIMNSAANLVMTGKLTEKDAVQYLEAFKTNWKEIQSGLVKYNIFGYTPNSSFILPYTAPGIFGSSSAQRVDINNNADTLTNLRFLMSKLNSEAPLPERLHKVDNKISIEHNAVNQMLIKPLGSSQEKN